MDSGFYAACAGLKAQSQALEVSAHNLANLNTTAYRGEQTTFRSLLAAPAPSGAGVVSQALNSAVNNFGVLEGTHLDLTPGNLLATGNPLDVAIEGAGFFAVETAQGTRYTRDGGFQVARNGQLVTKAGDPVLGANGPITIPAGPVAIAADGTISVNGTVAGSIRVDDFAAGTRLVSEGNNRIAAPEGGARPMAGPVLRQGTLESSNVNSINAVVALIGVQRQAETLERALSMLDSVLNRVASTELGKV